MDWKAIVNTVAPSIATALGGPLAGMAVKALASALLPNDPAAGETEVAKALAAATPETLERIKEADHNFALKMKELDVNLEKLAVDDTKDARAMQTATRSRMVPALAFLAVAVFALVGAYALFGNTAGNTAVTGIVMYLLGKWDSKVDMVYHFCFGSSEGSKQKDAALAEAAHKENN